MFRKSPIARLLVVLPLAASLAGAALVSSAAVVAPSAGDAGRAVLSCCCGTLDAHCCGTGCCRLKAPARDSSRQPVAPPDDQRNFVATVWVSTASPLPEHVLSGAAWHGRRPWLSSAFATLQALHVRLQV
jgi:hypothetical protein